jgi:hypothetical protein
MTLVQKTELNEDYKNASLSLDKRVESIGENLSILSSELELHQNELYFVKRGITQKAATYYAKANSSIKNNLIESMQEMEWSFVTDNVTGFCSAVYRQLEIFTNYILFEIKKCNDNISIDPASNKPVIGADNFINKYDGWFIYDYTTKSNKFVAFINPTDKKKFIEPYYLKTATNNKQGVLNISFPNKLNLTFGLYINKKIKHSDGNEYILVNNGYSELTQRIKDIRDSKEHGIISKHFSSWQTKDYYDSMKVLNELYQRIPDLTL